MDRKHDKDNRISEDGMTITEMTADCKSGDRPITPDISFARYKGHDAEESAYYKFVGVFEYNAQDSQDGVKRVYKRISDHLTWKVGNSADFE